MLSDENYRVRKYVIKALGRCGDPTTIDLLLAIFEKRETDLEVKEIIAETIGKIGGGYAMSILKGWIEEGTMEVRREAIKALGSMGNDAAIDALVSITKDKREDKIIKNHAKQALKNILNELKTNYMQLKKKIEKAI